MFRQDKYDVFMVGAAHNRHGRTEFFSKSVYADRLKMVSSQLALDKIDALVLFRHDSYTNPYLLWLAGKYESIDPYTYIVKGGKLIEVDDRPGGPPEGEDWPPKNRKPGDGPPKPPTDAPMPAQGEKGPAISPYLQPGAAEKIKKHLTGLNKIAFVGLGMVDYQFMTALKGFSPNAKLVDYSDCLNSLRAIKDEAELMAIREAVYVQEKALEALPNILRSCVYEKDAAAGLLNVIRRYGSDFCGGACPLASVVHIDGSKGGGQWPGPKWPAVDPRLVLLGGHGAGGYKAETARTVCAGKPSDAVLSSHKACVNLEDDIADLLTPGASPADVIQKAVVRPDLEIKLSGVGVTVKEKPVFSAACHEPLAANMVVSVMVKAKSGTVGVCDTYRLTKDRAKRLGTLERKIIII